MTQKVYTDPRPSEAPPDVIERWVEELSKWPLSKLRRHQRINLAYDPKRRTADLEVMREVYAAAIGRKCFKE